MRQLEHMSNEVILCIWDQLSSADVIYSFSNLNTRINSLLLEFHGLYKQLNLCHSSLPAFRFFCRQVSTINEWHLGLTVLKLGHPARCSQIDLFVNEIIKTVVLNYFGKQEISCNNTSKDIFRLLMTYKRIQPIFPQLVSLYIYSNTSVNEDILNTLLFIVAGGSAMRTFIWNSYPMQGQHSRVLFDWLLRHSINLVRFQLQSSRNQDGFEITYEHTIINTYVPHSSLVYLKINVRNLNTLYILLHYLPQLEHLGKNHITNIKLYSSVCSTKRCCCLRNIIIRAPLVLLQTSEIFIRILTLFSIMYIFYINNCLQKETYDLLES
jgi:hypothetical protein